MLMLVVAYVINEGVKNACGQVAMLVFTVILVAGNITWTVFQFLNFSACGYNVAFMCITIACAVIMFVIVPLRTREDASILTSAIVWTYNLYLQWSALSSNVTCNPLSGNAGATIAKECVGIFFMGIALFVISSINKKEGVTEDGGVPVAANEHLLVEEKDGLAPVNDVEVTDTTGAPSKITAEQQHVYPISTAAIYF
jgi:hypothetical protein